MIGSSVTMGSPVGPLRIERGETGLTRIVFQVGPDPSDSDAIAAEPAEGRGDVLLTEAVSQLSEYFEGRRTAFDLPLQPKGTDFQLRVWERLRAIPYGRTTSYGAIAAELGLPPGASRAVGLANGANPLAIVVPCHRVIGSDGTLVGYAGGLHRKRLLLDLESPTVQATLFS